jgi:hypothetical protein
MRIEILDSVEKDLLDGFHFYERQSRGLGDYFLDSLFSDIESLYLYAGIHAFLSDITACYPKDFPSLSTIG